MSDLLAADRQPCLLYTHDDDVRALYSHHKVLLQIVAYFDQSQICPSHTTIVQISPHFGDVPQQSTEGDHLAGNEHFETLAVAQGVYHEDRASNSRYPEKDTPQSLWIQSSHMSVQL